MRFGALHNGWSLGSGFAVAQLSAALPIVPAFSAAARSSGTVISARVQFTSIASFFMRANMAALNRPRVAGVSGAQMITTSASLTSFGVSSARPDVTQEVRPFAARVASRNHLHAERMGDPPDLDTGSAQATISMVAPCSGLEWRPLPLLSSSPRSWFRMPTSIDRAHAKT